MSWIQTSYLITEVIAIPLTGWLAYTPCAGYSPPRSRFYPGVDRLCCKR
jgi:hypothetical protein